MKHHRSNVRKKLQARNMAHAVGIAYDRGLLASSRSSTPSPISDGQIRAFHAKLGELAKRQRIDRQELKATLLEHMGAKFGRPIASVTELSQREANELLNYLEDEIVRVFAEAA